MPEKIIKIGNKKQALSPALLLFADYAKLLITSDWNIESLGTEVFEYNRKFAQEPVFEASMILGKIIYIDSYKNVMTNISRSYFEKIGSGRVFKIFIGSNRNTISRLSVKYSEVEPGELVALFNSLDLLEIAIFRGKVAELLNFNTQTQVRINFYD
jgi:S-adenosylmethionine hydrolase